MTQSTIPSELSARAADCSNVLAMVYQMLLTDNRHFDASVVRTCIDLLNREFVPMAAMTSTFHMQAGVAMLPRTSEPKQ